MSHPTQPIYMLTIPLSITAQESGEQPVEHIVPNPASEAHERIHPISFPPLKGDEIDELAFKAARKKNR